MGSSLKLKGLKLKGAVFLVCLYFLLFSRNVFSEDVESLREEVELLKNRIVQLEERLGKYEEAQVETEERLEKVETLPGILEGINIGAGATFVVQATDNANANNNPDEDVADASFSADLTFEKEVDDYGKVFLYLSAGESDGVTDELQLFSNVNHDADNHPNVYVVEGWYEHYLKSIPLTVTFGKLDATGYIDTNEYAGDECTQFLGSIFRVSPAIEFPDNGAGLHFGLAPAKFVDLNMVVMDGDGDWEDVFDGAFGAWQVNFKPNLFQRPGNYRIIAWVNDQHHTDWSDPTNNEEANFGFGLSIDQELTDNIGFFTRYAWQNPDIFMDADADGIAGDFSLEHSWSVGMQFGGAIWGRADDVWAFGVGQAIPSDDYEKANPGIEAKSEGHFETYYSYKVNDHLTLSPDLQVIWDPYGNDIPNGDDTIVVGGMRAQVDF